MIPQIPFETTGSTVGYTANCCMDMCPYEAFGPAVFYRFTAPDDLALRIDLCGSDYHTGLYLFDADEELVACNVDYYSGPPCGLWVSCIRWAGVEAGQDYVIVVTGESMAGNYVLAVTEEEGCEVDVPPGVVLEGEPPLADGYADAFNGGCNSPEFGSPFQTLTGDQHGELLLGGEAGWYSTPDGDVVRDTDWFVVTRGSGNVVEVSLQAEMPTYLYQLWPQNCQGVAVSQSALSQECQEVSFTVVGEPGAEVWIWVGSFLYTPPAWFGLGEYDYLLTITGLQTGPVAVERHSWSAIRGLFR